jgi:hypothetical protein
MTGNCGSGNDKKMRRKYEGKEKMELNKTGNVGLCTT